MTKLIMTIDYSITSTKYVVHKLLLLYLQRVKTTAPVIGHEHTYVYGFRTDDLRTVAILRSSLSMTRSYRLVLKMYSLFSSPRHPIHSPLIEIKSYYS